MKALVLSFIMFVGITAMAQEPAKKPNLFDKWPALKSFHSVMSETFHPSEEGDLKPIRSRSGEMVKKANELAASQIPADLNKDKIMASIKSLQTRSAELDKMIQNKANDEEVKVALSKLHDVFHEIVGLCREK